MKTLNDLINEVLKESNIVLEYRFNQAEAAQVLRSYGVKNADKLSFDGLKKMYRKLSSKYHPDAGGTHEDFLKINAAYEALRAYAGSQQQSYQDEAEEQRKREQAQRQERERQEEENKRKREQRARENAEREQREQRAKEEQRAQEQERARQREYYRPGGQADKDQQDWLRSQEDSRKRSREEHENWLDRFFRQGQETRDEIAARIRRR